MDVTSVEVLVDTNVVIWLDQRSRPLSPRAQSIVEDRNNRLLVSAASAWEIATKQRKAKLSAGISVPSFVAAYDAEELDVTVADGELAGALIWPNNDPFDRMILAQAERRGLTLITSDRAMMLYAPVAIVAAV